MASLAFTPSVRVGPKSLGSASVPVLALPSSGRNTTGNEGTDHSESYMFMNMLCTHPENDLSSLSRPNTTVERGTLSERLPATATRLSSNETQ